MTIGKGQMRTIPVATAGQVRPDWALLQKINADVTVIDAALCWFRMRLLINEETRHGRRGILDVAELAILREPRMYHGRRVKPAGFDIIAHHAI